MDKLLLQVEILRNTMQTTNENELKNMKDGFFTIGETIANSMNEGLKKSNQNQ